MNSVGGDLSVTLSNDAVVSIRLAVGDWSWRYLSSFTEGTKR